MAKYKCGAEAMVGDVVNNDSLGERTVLGLDDDGDPVFSFNSVGNKSEYDFARNCTLVRRAAPPDAERPTDQQLIAAKFDALKELCLRKNADYGSNFAAIPCLAPGVKASDAVLVRMSDKIARLQRLMYGPQPKVKESIEDTVSDLSVYGILYLLAREKEASE